MIKEGEEKPLKQVPDQKQASSGNGGAGGNGRQAKKQTKNRPRQPRKPRPNQGMFYRTLLFIKWSASSEGHSAPSQLLGV